MNHASPIISKFPTFIFIWGLLNSSRIFRKRPLAWWKSNFTRKILWRWGWFSTLLVAANRECCQPRQSHEFIPSKRCPFLAVVFGRGVAPKNFANCLSLEKHPMVAENRSRIRSWWMAILLGIPNISSRHDLAPDGYGASTMESPWASPFGPFSCPLGHGWWKRRNRSWMWCTCDTSSSPLTPARCLTATAWGFGGFDLWCFYVSWLSSQRMKVPRLLIVL